MSRFRSIPPCGRIYLRQAGRPVAPAPASPTCPVTALRKLFNRFLRPPFLQDPAALSPKVILLSQSGPHFLTPASGFSGYSLRTGAAVSAEFRTGNCPNVRILQSICHADPCKILMQVSRSRVFCGENLGILPFHS
jgi:hypothetical protein